MDAAIYFTTKLSQIKQKLLNHFVLTVGDFNLTNLSWVNSHSCNAFEAIYVTARSEDLIYSFSFLELSQFNAVPNFNKKILDSILCNNNLIRNVQKCDVPLIVEDKFHPSIEFSFETTNFTCFKNVGIPYIYNYKKADHDLIVHSLDYIL